VNETIPEPQGDKVIVFAEYFEVPSDALLLLPGAGAGELQPRAPTSVAEHAGLAEHPCVGLLLG
jgi:hypothetical protein